MAAQEKPKVIPVDNFVRDELYPGYTQSGQVAPDYWAVDRADVVASNGRIQTELLTALKGDDRP